MDIGVDIGVDTGGYRCDATDPCQLLQIYLDRFVHLQLAVEINMDWTHCSCKAL